MELLESIAAINTTILVLVLTYYFLKGFIEPRSYFTAGLLIFTISFGLAAAKMLPNPNGVAITNSIVCTKGEYWSECSGWVFYFDFFAEFVRNISALASSGVSVSASTAIFLGSWYIHSKILAGLTFNPKDLLKAFAAGFLVYTSLLYLPYLQENLNKIVIDLTSLNQVSEGKKVLKSWTEAITVYRQYASEESSLSKLFQSFILQSILFLPFVLTDLINLLLIIFQNSIVVLVPLSLFMASLSRYSDPTYVIALLFNYGLVSFMQSVEWLAISLLPKIEVNPTVSNQTMTDIVNYSLPAAILFLALMLVVSVVSVKFIVFPTLRMLLNPRIMAR